VIAGESPRLMRPDVVVAGEQVAEAVARARARELSLIP
jgi:hypothetical protein